MTARILITGASGNVGREIIKRLSQLEIDVRAAIHDFSNDHSFEGFEHVEKVHLDFNDINSIERALDGIEKLFLLTPATKEQPHYVENILTVAHKNHISHCVRLSIMGAEQMPLIAFARWHHESEKLIIESQIPYTILRPNSFMQNFINYIHPQGGMIYLPIDEGKVSYIDISDVAAVSAAILQARDGHLSQIYTLTGPDSLSGNDIAKTLTTVTGSQVEYVDISEDSARTALELQKYPQWLIEATLEQYAFQKFNLSIETTDWVKILSGRSPKSFLDFARDHATTFRELVKS